MLMNRAAFFLFRPDGRTRRGELQFPIANPGDEREEENVIKTLKYELAIF